VYFGKISFLNPMILLSNFTKNKISEKLLNDFAVVAIEMMKGGKGGGWKFK
jgi:hypothetical protein